MEEHPGPPFNLLRDNIRIYLALTRLVTRLPERKRCSLRGVASLEEPEPLSPRNVSTSTNFASPYLADHRHICSNINVTRILGDTGRRLTNPRICNVAKICVILNLGTKSQCLPCS